VLQLDQNQQAEGSDSYTTQTSSIDNRVSAGQLARMDRTAPVDRGDHIDKVTDAKGAPLPYTINKTMMRVDLPEPLPSGQSFVFKIEWWYNINDRMKEGGRSGYEYFPKDSNYLYAIAQFFPRMCVYDDINGWQNKQFLGAGEFTLVFGDYDVRITVPSDHAIAATGVLQNPKEVLTKAQQDRYAQAQKSYAEPVKIITNEEALKNESGRAKTEKTSLYGMLWLLNNPPARMSSRCRCIPGRATRSGRCIPLKLSRTRSNGIPITPSIFLTP
jgi:hypothetical protein